jgi:hypothetical protein
MSINLSSAASAQFDAEVKHAFQTAGKLRNAVRMRTGVVGDTYNFRTMGKGLANQKASQTDVTPMDISHTKVPVTLGNWVAGEYTDIFDAAEVNFDERRELAQTIAGAMGRRSDQLVIDALTAGETIVHGSTGLNLAKITSASEALNDNGVPMNDRFLLTSAEGISDLLNVEQATSADYATVRALMSGEINTFMGFNIIMMETRSEGGLSKTSTTRDCYAFHKSAIGCAIGMDISTEVNYIPEKTSWLSLGKYKAGAATIDSTGIVKVEITE